MSGFAWLPPEDSERLEEEERWIDEHGPITGTEVLMEADLPRVVSSWRVLEPPLRASEIAAMPDATAAGDNALLAMEEALRDA